MEKLDHEQLIDLVGRLQRGEVPEEKSAAALDALVRSTGNPQVSELIFYPEAEGLTAEQILDQALAYRPIEL